MSSLRSKALLCRLGLHHYIDLAGQDFGITRYVVREPALDSAAQVLALLNRP